MTADEVKAALRRRHPAVGEYGEPGQWTTVAEWYQIDLLAIAAWTQPKPARTAHERIGYEVKVSRSDYRRELLNPYKRRAQVAFCHEFYFAVPEGLLRPQELDWQEPDWIADPASFSRTPCPERCRRPSSTYRPEAAGKTGREERIETTDGFGRPHDRWHWQVCRTCAGRGYLAKSRVEAEAPMLWVPTDVGLITVNSRGCHVARKAPMGDPGGRVTDRLLGDLVRWVSYRPDPRHTAARTPTGVQLSDT